MNKEKGLLDNTAVSTIIENSTKSAWIGLYCFENDPEKCSWDSENGNAKEYNNFAANFPYIEMDKCVYFKSSGKLAGKWLSGDCQEDQRSFVCEIPTTSFEARAWPGHYYQWVDDSKFDYFNFDVKAENCLTMSLKTTVTKTSGFWYGTDCLATEHFLCKRWIGKDCESSPSTVAPLESKEYYSFFMKSGTFSSPNYPKNYTANSTSVYSLATLGSQKIRLTFNEILTEPDYDQILIYDGDSVESPLIGNFSGVHFKKQIESSTNNLYITFITDSTVNSFGFTASFQSII
ncbi:Protein CBG13436 [Caenorhabditis briggsae]|uniref:Protein CBG13436 n=1 Tax=Caenorhabditis briggsae TaxID=6238 RepID=A8XHR8_CAEBR|nr:Protein CBG13436 [Caenorhabditis briggsae]CAP32185.2 Protein CBG13436 [Caenorhabditis briggsae]